MLKSKIVGRGHPAAQYTLEPLKFGSIVPGLLLSLAQSGEKEKIQF